MGKIIERETKGKVLIKLLRTRIVRGE